MRNNSAVPAGCSKNCAEATPRLWYVRSPTSSFATQFRADMDNAVSIERRLKAMRQVYEAGIRTVCFVSPIFPGITDVKTIIKEVKGYADLIWLENLNLRGQFKGEIMAYIREKHPELFPLYDEIYNKKRLDYWQALEQDISQYAQTQGFPYRVNDLPYGRSEKGKPVIVNYFYHARKNQAQKIRCI